MAVSLTHRTHYGVTREELASMRAVHPSTLDSRMTPLCGNGSYHAAVTRNKADVNCHACIARMPGGSKGQA